MITIIFFAIHFIDNKKWRIHVIMPHVVMHSNLEQNILWFGSV